MDNGFSEIIRLIKQARINTLKIVNSELINLYWKIGQHIYLKIEQSNWEQSIVQELAEHIQNTELNFRVFSDKNLWRMKQFYETYKNFQKLSPLVREIIYE